MIKLDDYIKKNYTVAENFIRYDLLNYDEIKIGELTSMGRTLGLIRGTNQEKAILNLKKMN